MGDKTSYVYERLGRERSRISGIGDCEYTLDYDALGRVTARTDGGIEKKHYDAEGYRDSITEKDKELLAKNGLSTTGAKKNKGEIS